MFEATPHLMHQAFDSMLMHLRHHKASQNLRPEWQPLADDLHRIGLEKSVSDAWVSWASSRETHFTPVRIRLLHPMEKELISLEAFNDLLELIRLGVLNSLQLENVIENCAYLSSLPAGKEQVRILTLRVFADQFQSQGYGPSH
jgi:hypothetical protein